jgi:hypothetical protein
VLAGAKVAFQNDLDSRRQCLLRNGRQYRKTRIAQKLRMRRIACAQYIEQTLLDEILTDEEHAVAPREEARKHGLAAARQAGDEEHS